MFFVSDAMAAGEAAAQVGGMEGFLMQVVPLVVIFAVFWFFLIRPQQKRQKEHMQMCEGLTRGDEVTTLGGISGRIESVDEQTIGLQVASVPRSVRARDRRRKARRDPHAAHLGQRCPPEGHAEDLSSINVHALKCTKR